MQEIISDRSYNRKVFSLPDGRKKYQFHAGHIHYKDGLEFKDVDYTLRLEESHYIVDKASYTVQIPKFSDEEFTFVNRYHKSQQTIKAKPITSHVEGVKENNTIRYANAFGKGIDLTAEPQRHGILKLITIHEKPASIEDLRFNFELTLPPESVLKKVSGELRDKTGLVDFKGESLKIETVDSESFFKQSYVWDSAGNIEPVNIQTEVIDGKTILTKTITSEFLNTATFPVYTDHPTDYFSGAGDGQVGNQFSASWSTIHDASSGSFAATANFTHVCKSFKTSGGSFSIARVFSPIDTSGIDDGDTIDSASLNIYLNSLTNTEADGNDFFSIVQTSQADPTTLSVDDFDQCGDAISNPTEGSSRIDIDTLSIDQYNAIPLNSTGLGWINKTGYSLLGLREGHDILNDPITSNNSEVSIGINGIGFVPYLEVTVAGASSSSSSSSNSSSSSSSSRSSSSTSSSSSSSNSSSSSSSRSSSSSSSRSSSSSSSKSSSSESSSSSSSALTTRQVVISGNGSGNKELVNSSDNYSYLFNNTGFGAFWDTSISNWTLNVVPISCSIDNFRVHLPVAPGSGKSWTFTVYKNGSPTDVEVVISGTNTSGVDSVNSASFAQGDKVALKVTPSGSPTATSPSWVFDTHFTEENACLFCTGGGAPEISVDNMTPVGYYSWELHALSAQSLIPCSGKIKNLFIDTDVPPGAGLFYELTLAVNEVNTALKVRLEDSDLAGNNTTDEVSVVAGDLITVHFPVYSEEWNSGTTVVSWVFIPDDPVFPFITFQPNSVTDGSTFYAGVNGFGENFTQGSATQNRQVTNHCFINKIAVKVSNTEPGDSFGSAGRSRTYTLRVNGVNSSLSVTVTDPDLYAEATGSVEVQEGDFLDTIITQSGVFSGETIQDHIAYTASTEELSSSSSSSSSSTSSSSSSSRSSSSSSLSSSSSSSNSSSSSSSSSESSSSSSSSSESSSSSSSSSNSSSSSSSHSSSSESSSSSSSLSSSSESSSSSSSSSNSSSSSSSRSSSSSSSSSNSSSSSSSRSSSSTSSSSSSSNSSSSESSSSSSSLSNSSSSSSSTSSSSSSSSSNSSSSTSSSSSSSNSSSSSSSSSTSSSSSSSSRSSSSSSSSSADSISSSSESSSSLSSSSSSSLSSSSNSSSSSSSNSSSSSSSSSNSSSSSSSSSQSSLSSSSSSSSSLSSSSSSSSSRSSSSSSSSSHSSLSSSSSSSRSSSSSSSSSSISSSSSSSSFSESSSSSSNSSSSSSSSTSSSSTSSSSESSSSTSSSSSSASESTSSSSSSAVRFYDDRESFIYPTDVRESLLQNLLGE